MQNPCLFSGKKIYVPLSTSAGSSIHNILCTIMGCNSLQWIYVLSSHTHAKQCNTSMCPITFCFFFWIVYLLRQHLHCIWKFQMAVGMSDRAYQSDARADKKVCSQLLVYWTRIFTSVKIKDMKRSSDFLLIEELVNSMWLLSFLWNL